jgi:glutamine phosphoribosylpyrophosphate amidotransferase
MCGVVGVRLQNVTYEDVDLVKNVFKESEIRGKHASGIAWFDGKTVRAQKDALPISEFLKNFDIHDCVYNESLTLVGHIRYSTSDIKYNQPIGYDGKSYIVHNGVVTQSDPELWEERYGYHCETKNDSELLFHCLEEKCDIETKFPRASYALLRLDNDGSIQYFRNGLRPMWVAHLENGEIFASTRDILFRAGVPKDKIEKITVPGDKQQRFLNG